MKGAQWDTWDMVPHRVPNGVPFNSEYSSSFSTNGTGGSCNPKSHRSQSPKLPINLRCST